MGGHEEIRKYERSGEGIRHHRRQSSETLLDKAAILAALELKPGLTVLDAGCGTGYMAREFSRRVGPEGRVYALDRDETAVAALAEETAGSNLTALAGDIAAGTGLPSGAFDLVYLSAVYHTFDAEMVRGFAAEVRRLLAPGGKLAVVEVIKGPTPFGPPQESRRSPEDLKRELGFIPLATVKAGEYFYLQLFRLPEP